MQKPLTVLDFEKSIAELDKNISAYRDAASDRGQDYEQVISDLESTRQRLLEEIFSHLTPWDQVLLARHQNRPYSLDYIRMMCEDFVELRGDRHVADDQAIVGGPARIDGKRVMLIGQQKGRDIKERALRNFGIAKPEGYRKAIRLMKLAEKLRMPVVTLVDTSGADSNPDSEGRAICEAIAVNLMQMSALTTPIVCVVIGEGGSGGALGIAVADRVLMLEHAIYSVITPEGCAAILDTFGRDPERKNDAAKALRVDAASALELGIVDEVLPEPLGAAHFDAEAAAATVKEAIVRNLEELAKLSTRDLLERRYRKYRGMGLFDKGDAVECPESGAA
jgi:acetyl-CoA carboxylase carboxyl transferase subunit alpha